MKAPKEIFWRFLMEKRNIPIWQHNVLNWKQISDRKLCYLFEELLSNKENLPLTWKQIVSQSEIKFWTLKENLFLIKNKLAPDLRLGRNEWLQI